LEILGLDASTPAIEYARQVGLLQDGWAENLECGVASTDLLEGVREVDMLICTGGVGYVGARTFEQIADAVQEPENLWAVSFVLRMFDYTDIADVLSGHGLVTECIPDQTFVQRRFRDPEEQAAAIEGVRARGLDPAGLESEGWFHAQCYISRPPQAVEEMPVTEFALAVE
jgi:hypothetical protein